MKIMIGLVIGGAAFVFIRFVRKYSALNSIVFAFFVLLVTLFITDYRWSTVFRRRADRPVYLLVDKSASITLDSGEEKKLNALRQLFPARRVYYFADTLSRDAEGLNPERTTLYDSVRTLRSTIEPEARIVAVSDFQDNYSLNNPLPVPAGVFPVSTSRSNTRPLLIYAAEIPELIQSGEKTEATVSVYSAEYGQGKIAVYSGETLLAQKEAQFQPGTNRITVPLRIEGKGERILTFSLKNGGSPAGETDKIRRMVMVLPGFYRILVVAGRPSIEFAFLRRFMENIRWIEADFQVLSRPGQTYDFTAINKYSGILLVDVSDKQLGNIQTLRDFRKPVFWQTGTAPRQQITLLASVFTNFNWSYQVTEKKMTYNDRELIVTTAYNTDKMFYELSDNRRLFLGWNSWKWDFSALASGLQENNYESFWKNQINYLISREGTQELPEKWNYVKGENALFDTKQEGVVEYRSEGKTFRALVSANPQERALIFPRVEIAHLYNTNTVSLKNLENPSAFLKRVRGNEKIIISSELNVDFRKNMAVFILMILSILFFWFNSDREKLLK